MPVYKVDKRNGEEVSDYVGSDEEIVSSRWNGRKEVIETEKIEEAECPDCGDTFDSEHAMKTHRGQVH